MSVILALLLSFQANAKYESSWEDFRLGELVAVALADQTCLANIVEFKMVQGRRTEARMNGCARLIGQYEYHWHPHDRSRWNGEPSEWMGSVPLHTTGCESGGFCVGDRIVMFKDDRTAITRAFEAEITALTENSSGADFIGRTANRRERASHFFDSPFEPDLIYFGKGSGCRMLKGKKYCVGDQIVATGRYRQGSYWRPTVKVIALTDPRMKGYHGNSVMVTHACYLSTSTCYNLLNSDEELEFGGGA